MKILPILPFFLVQCYAGLAHLPVVAAGEIRRIENFKSAYVTARNVDVWLPEGYSDSQKYAVLYMHDGQMLFDSNSTWNKTAWDVDDVITEMNRTGKLKKVIVVGIWNDGASRHSDYFPQKPFESLATAQKDSIQNATRNNGYPIFGNKAINSNNYLKFLVKELKPFIDANYAVNADRAHTFIAGSSMGGLISMYAICEYPQVFGGAACMSTHWPGIFTMHNNPVPEAFMQYLRAYLPEARTHKIYFDCGDKTLDALYPPVQKKVDDIMRSKGYTAKNWLTGYFPGEDHSENAWHKRLHIPLMFLLKK